MQNRDGGWGAFDRDNDRQILCNIPFADHNAMIDPSTADVTARVLECLGRFGWPADHPVIRKAVGFLTKDQCKDGSWFGRWGVNYVYGTSGVLRALETVSLTAQDYCARAVAWLRKVQKEDGSFGESLLSYEFASTKGQGNSTPSQTAWGLIGLLAAADPNDPAVGRAAAYLVQQQNANGSWSEDDFTGTGFPGVFYLKYHLYKNSFPVYALARFRNQGKRAEEYCAFTFKPGEFRVAERSLYQARTERFLSKRMRYPLGLVLDSARHLASRKLRGDKKIPLILSLEPLGGSASACSGGCTEWQWRAQGRAMLTVEQCLEAMQECDTPVVVICGGEPLEYPEIARLTREILCTRKASFSVHRRHDDPPATAHDSAVHEFLLECEAGWHAGSARCAGRAAGLV